MTFTKAATLIALCLFIGIAGCATGQKAEAPKQEQVTTNMVPAKAEIKGQAFLIELSDLKVVSTVDIASKKIVETPSLKGSIKITNKSKEMLDIQAVNFEYLDESGKVIPYATDEKIVKVSPFWKSLAPDAVAEGNLDISLPTTSMKEKPFGKIGVNLIYVASPLKQEALTLSGKLQ
jgi:hypothetical protein